MKRLLILTAILMMAIVVKAQHEEGDFMVQPKFGMNIATLSDADKSITDLHFGLEAEYMVTDNFSLGLGAILSNQGAKYDFWDEYNGQNKYTVDLDYVHVPILASYYVLPGLAVKAGIQPGFKMRAKAKFDDRTIDLDELYKLGSVLLDEDIKVSKFDFSISVGASYEYKNFVLDARYNWGLLKVMNVGDAFYNRCFMLSLGYKFQLGD
jgi:hypothetical protein